MRNGYTGYSPMLIVAALSLILASCTNDGLLTSGSESDSLKTLAGRASLGPIKNATVSVYPIDSSGQRGALITSSTTDAEGLFSLQLANNLKNLEIVITGGSYQEESGGATVSLENKELSNWIDDLEAINETSVTALTQIAAKRAKKLLVQGIDLEEAIRTAHSEIQEVSGVETLHKIPANPEQNIELEDPQSRKYALFLAGLSKLSADKGSNSFDCAQAFANDFQNDGQLDGSDDGKAILLGSSGDVLDVDDWETDLPQAIDDFIVSGDNSAGFDSTVAPELIDDATVAIPEPIHEPIVESHNAPAFFSMQVLDHNDYGPNQHYEPTVVPTGVCVPLRLLILDQQFNEIPLTEVAFLQIENSYDPFSSSGQFYTQSDCLDDFGQYYSTSYAREIPIEVVPHGNIVYFKSDIPTYYHLLNMQVYLGESNLSLSYYGIPDIISDPSVGGFFDLAFNVLGVPSVINVGDCVPAILEFQNLFSMQPLYIDDHMFGSHVLISPSQFGDKIEFFNDSSCSSAGGSFDLPIHSPVADIYIKALSPGVVGPSDYEIPQAYVMSPFTSGFRPLHPLMFNLEVQ